MKTTRFGAILLLSAVLAAGCGGGGHEASGHEGEAARPAAEPPTPDTTPVQALRTPAGIALRPGEAVVRPTPAPGQSETPK